MAARTERATHCAERRAAIGSTGGAGGDALEGGDGNDDVDGGGDADSLSGGPGEDELKAGDGDDRLEGGAGPDELNGGPGTDTVRYVSTSPVQVTLDGEDNDGAVTLSDEGRSRVEEGARSEGDNVDATNERVDGSRVDDTVSGDADPNELTGAAGEDYLDGQSRSRRPLGRRSQRHDHGPRSTAVTGSAAERDTTTSSRTAPT